MAPLETSRLLPRTLATTLFRSATLSGSSLRGEAEPTSSDHKGISGSRNINSSTPISGASTEDTAAISLDCPNSLKMLIDGVDDLDDWYSLAAAAKSARQ